MDWQGPTLIFNLREGLGSSVGRWYGSMVECVFEKVVLIPVGSYINNGERKTKQCIYYGEELPKCLLWEVS